MRRKIARTTEKCLLRAEAREFCRQAGVLKDEETTGLLLQLGLSCEELESLDLRSPLLQEIAEYVGIRFGESQTTSDAVRILEATRKVIRDHLQDIDSQMWMLQHRRDSLERKMLVVEHLLRVLRPLPKPRAA